MRYTQISSLGAWLPIPASALALPVASRALVNQSSANPVNLTALNTDVSDGWVSNPDGRGTWNILCNCIFTLILCVFTAIHLNVGPAGETELQFWLRKCKWVVVATFAPEMVLYAAGKQWFSATRLCKKLNNWRVNNDGKNPETPSKEVNDANSTDPQTDVSSLPPEIPERYPSIFGFFIVMGGFLVDVSHMHNTLSRLTITPKGVAFLAKHGRFLAAPVDSIRDKSKADVLAKGLVCFQVGWLLLQTISRKAVGYPITLLELHVLVHCACAIAMYGLWFHKPMDLRDPILLDSSDWEDLLALMLVRNYGLGSKGCKKGNDHATRLHASTSGRWNGAESAYIHVYSDLNKGPERPATEMASGVSAAARVNELARSDTRIKQDQCSQEMEPENMTDPVFSIKPTADVELICTLVSGQFLDCGLGPSKNVVPTVHGSRKVSNPGRLEISLTSKDVRRWTLASRALQKYGGELHNPGGSVNYLVSNAPNIFLDRKGVHAGFYAFFCSWASGGLIAALVVCCFYGATHALAWNFPFPSPAEHLLWKIASIDIIAGTVTILALFSVVVYLHEHEPRSLITSISTKEPGILPILYRIIVLVGLLNVPLFLFSRIFVVFESFLSLRRVSRGVYLSVQWTQYIPHLS